MSSAWLNDDCPCSDYNPEPTPEDIARNNYEDMLETLPRLFGTGRCCCFTDLPAKLRNKIYAMVAASAKARHEYHSSSLLAETPFGVVHDDLRALLRVSRSVRSETASFLWSQNGFSLDLKFVSDNDNGMRREKLSGRLGKWVQVWGALALPYLRNLHFQFDHAQINLSIDAECPERNYVFCISSEDHTDNDNYSTSDDDSDIYRDLWKSSRYLISDDDNDFEVLVLAVFMPDGQLGLAYERIVWLDEVLRERSRIVNIPDMSP